MLRKSMLVIVLFVFAILFLVVSTTCGAQEIPTFVRMSASSPGGNWYAQAAAMCVLIEKEFPGVPTTVLPGGGVANVRTVDRGDAETALTQTSSAGDARNAVAPYEEKFDNVRHVFSVSPQGVHFIVRADSPITSISELKNKRIGMAPVGTGANLLAEWVFEVYGFTLKDIKEAGGTISYLDHTTSPGMIADRNIDVLVALGTHPWSPLNEIDFNPGIKLLGIDEDKLDELLALHPSISKVTIAKETYTHLENDITTIGNYNAIICNAGLSDEFVYRMTKAIFENISFVWAASPVIKDFFNLESALNGAVIPLHPGALKYYVEQGLDIEGIQTK